jgi:hypothetical protein
MVNNIFKPEPTFRIFPKSDATFGVEILIEGTEPTSVTSFPSEAAAADWIAAYQRRLEEGAKPRGRRSWAGR